MFLSPLRRVPGRSLIVISICLAIIPIILVITSRPHAAGALPDHRSVLSSSLPARNGVDLHPAAAGDLDTTFDPGLGVTRGGTVLANAVQSDGKILLGGLFSSYNGTSCNGLVRVNSNGSIDTSFHSGAAAVTTIYSIVIQNDGKILIGGRMATYDGASRNGVARLNVDGTLDTTFNPGSGVGSIFTVYGIAVQPDQKIVLGGNFISFNGVTRVRIARLNADGSVDSSFDPVNGASPRIYAVAIQGDGKIIAGGAFTSFNGTARAYVVRLNPNGSVDTSFVPGIQVSGNGSVFALNIQPDGKVIVGGLFNVSGVASMLARLNGDGAIDPSFTVASGGTVHALTVQNDGKIVVAGSFITYSGTSRRGIARANNNGTLDTSFVIGSGASGGLNPPGTVLRPNSLALQLDGKIMFGGAFTNYASISCAGIVRINNDGSADATFDSGNGAATAGFVNCVRVQSDAKILIGGQLTGYNNVKRAGIARVNSDGSLDSSFDPGSGTGEISTVNAMAIQTDGKILIGGGFATYNGVARNGFARINTDGSLDNSFSPSANDLVTAIALQNDGRIVIGGNFTTYQGVSRKGIARINADGTLDSSFNPGSGLSGNTNSVPGTINSIAIQPDGKILVGGDFQNYNGVLRNALVRINADGSIDGSFNPNTLNSLNEVIVQNDGRILIAGISSVFFNGQVSREGIARLNSDGSLDTAFNPGIVFDPVLDDFIEMDDLALQSDGRIIVTGSFARYDGVPRNGLARANLDGHIDSSFVGSGALAILDTTIQLDGKILIAGSFADYNGTPRSGIARLLPGPLTTIPTIQLSASSYSVNEADSQVLVQVNRTGDLSVASAVDYTTSDTATTNCNATGGQASSRCDYLKSVGRLLFAANESTKTISIPIVDDAYNEGSETFTFTLTNPSNANLGPATASITINDNDAGGGANPIDQSTFFVRQHYFDFLNRQPDQSGLDFWVGNIENCSPKPVCLEVRRIDTSASFYLSIEFQGTGYLVERLYKTAYGDATGTSTFNSTHSLAVPIVRFDEFLAETQDIGRSIIVGQPGWEQQFEKNKSDFVAAFVQRARFTAAFPANMSSEQFVSVLNANAGSPLSPSERTQLENELSIGTKNRGQVLRAIAEHQNLVNSEFNRAFVLMQYFGYLRRNPNDPQDTDYTGYDFWLTKLNQFNGNYINAEMVKAFLSSIEYRQRFGP